MSLLLTFYGDDFTGSTDALEQLTRAGIRTALFIHPPTPRQLKQFKNLQAVGIAGMTRALAPAAMEQELQPTLKKLKALGARHVHYKVCSTFDSSPKIGSIGRVIDIARGIFKTPFVPVLAAAPALGRFTVFGNHFARYGIGSTGAIHRLDQHPSISRHPITPMTEADLQLHLSKQTRRKIGLFDILKVNLPAREARAELNRLVKSGAEIVLFDALCSEQLRLIGELIDGAASAKRPLFSVGSSGIESALAAHWNDSGKIKAGADLSNNAAPVKQMLIGSGSCSPVTSRQIAWALDHGFAEVKLNALAVNSDPTREFQRCAKSAAAFLASGRSVIIHTTRNGADKRVAKRYGNRTASILGTALGTVISFVLKQSSVTRICIAGGDTSSYAARALGIEALEMIAPLTPGAPLCRAMAMAPGLPIDGLEVVFKGGQVGGEDYFEIVKNGK